MSEFERLTKLIRAKDIQYRIGAVGHFRAGDEIPVFCDDKFGNSLPSIVVDGDHRPVGWFDSQELEVVTGIFEPEVEEYIDVDELGNPVHLPPESLKDPSHLKASEKERLSDVEAARVRDIMHPLTPSDIISPDTTVHECLELIAIDASRLLVVMNQTEPVGLIQFRDLFGSLGRLCLLRLVFDLEVAAIDLLWAQDFKRIGSILDEEDIRHNKAIEEKRPGDSSLWRMKQQYFKRHSRFMDKRSEMTEDERREQNAKLWMCKISFARRREIIKQYKLLIPGIGYNKIEKIFEDTEFLRNCCAHPTGLEDERWYFTPPPEIDESKFGDLYRDIRWLTTEMREQAAREDSVRNRQPPGSG